jgi:hypothetical protein
MSIAVRLSCALYEALLFAYPPAFRHAYSQEMAQVFRDGCVEALQRRGMCGLARYWLFTLRDLIVSACMERLAALDRRAAGLAALAFGCGLLAAYVDFHATEVQATVLVLLLFTFAFGFASPRRAWRLGLAVGIAVPLAHILNHLLHRPPPYPVEPNLLATLIALIPAQIGATMGAFARWLLIAPV